MEESSRGLLQHKQKAEQLKQERAALTLSYEVSIDNCTEYVAKAYLTSLIAIVVIVTWHFRASIQNSP